LSEHLRLPASPTLRTTATASLAALSMTAALISGAPVAAAMPDRDDQARFMWAMAGQESGWDYFARNASSGAFGRYQIMPFNWPAWAAEYLADPRADQTPWNQERVAFGKIRDLYRWLGSWRRVAYWWLTGRTDRDDRRWSAYADGYVKDIMRLRQRAPRGAAPSPARVSSLARPGDWRRSASRQSLHLGVSGRVWSRGGFLRDGEVLRVRRGRTKRSGVPWIAVVTVDGRLGWLRRQETLPAERPAGAARWQDVDERGRPSRSDRRMAQPRPR
jgi:hypothetical protein